MIAILDYGLGNISAFANIFKQLSIPHYFCKNAIELKNATKILLPGVGSFDSAMHLLNRSGMRDQLDWMVLENKTPILGVCLGMQMMGLSSEEGSSQGLGWIDGVVRQIDVRQLEFKPKTPHMGWNSLQLKKKHKVFDFVDPRKGFYFLHSYHFECDDPNDILSVTEYGNMLVSSFNKHNIFGFQFHPEKSHSNGIHLLRNFWSI